MLTPTPDRLSHSDDELVLMHAIDYLDQGKTVALATVLKTWGSSPRPSGSLLVMCNDGIHYGSVSGGCIEQDLFDRFAKGELSLDRPSILDYGINRQDAQRFGLPCGGRLEILVERLESPTQLTAILKAIQKGQLIKRSVCLNTGEVSLHKCTESPMGARADAPKEPSLSYNPDNVTKVFGPQWQLFLVGAGHLSHYVAQMASLLGYAVTVCDPREEYQLSWQQEPNESAHGISQSAGITFTTEMPDDAVLKLANRERTAVITLTHDPKLDDMALMEALRMGFFYVGALGSQKTNANRRERLLQLGLTGEQTAALHGPVGLAIGSHSPPEIAVSIMAELTAIRNNAAILVSASTQSTSQATHLTSNSMSKPDIESPEPVRAAIT